jgi:hypothetical protein
MRAGPGASLVVTSELTSESHLGDGAPPDLSGVWIQDAITSVIGRNSYSARNRVIAPQGKAPRHWGARLYSPDERRGDGHSSAG